MVNNLKLYTEYLYKEAETLHKDAKSNLDTLLVDQTITKTTKNSIETRVNKLILFSKPKTPDNQGNFDKLCTLTFKPFFEECNTIFRTFTRINNNAAAKDTWSKNIKTTSKLINASHAYFEKNPPPTPEKVENKPLAKPKEAESMSLREFMTKNGLIGLPENLDVVLRPLTARGHLRGVRDDRGVTFDKGMILHGPPGTGKTSVVRILATYLGCAKENVQLISAPELVSSLVGDTEKNMRERFRPSIEAWEKLGENSPLYILAIDEFENLALDRASTDKDYSKRSVTQFLTLLDGFTLQKNLLVIGITNHISMIDPALLRNGRFGIQIEIGLPDKEGRESILNLYLKDLLDNEYVAESLTVAQIAELTEGFSGADLKGVVQSANRTAYNRYSEAWNGQTDREICKALGKITLEDFKPAIIEIKSLKKTNEIPCDSTITPKPTTTSATQTVETAAKPTTAVATQTDETLTKPSTTPATQTVETAAKPTTAVATQTDETLTKSSTTLSTQTDEIPAKKTTSSAIQTDEIPAKPSTTLAIQTDEPLIKPTAISETQTEIIPVKSTTLATQTENTLIDTIAMWIDQNIDDSTLEEVDREPIDSLGVRLLTYLTGHKQSEIKDTGKTSIIELLFQHKTAICCILDEGKLKKVSFIHILFEKVRGFFGYRDRTKKVFAKINDLRKLLKSSDNIDAIIPK